MIGGERRTSQASRSTSQNPGIVGILPISTHAKKDYVTRKPAGQAGLNNVPFCATWHGDSWVVLPARQTTWKVVLRHGQSACNPELNHAARQAYVFASEDPGTRRRRIRAGPASPAAMSPALRYLPSIAVAVDTALSLRKLASLTELGRGKNFWNSRAPPGIL